MSIIIRLFSLLFGGCLHAHATFPQTPVRKSGFREATYVCCLDCGRRFEYDWRAMKRGAEIRRETPAITGAWAEAES